MKVGLIGINSQFVHSNLALFYLREELPSDFEGELLEYNNNEPILKIFYDIVGRELDIAAFSVYIWNKETVNKLLPMLKDACPDMKIILGGPEPTYLPEDFSKADYIVAGASERSWAKLLTAIAEGREAGNLPGLDGNVAFSEDWPFPYHEADLPRMEHRLVYYETSRGCPYRCSFCLSSAEKGVALRPLERVFHELDFFLKHHIPVVKLVDRTFNAPAERGKKILRYLLEHYAAGMTFHFELKGELLDEETVFLLTSAPRDFFQVEIGIQSLNGEVLKKIGRVNSWEKTKDFYRRLAAAENLHTHFDLIAGLPGEDLVSFKNGFNEVMTIRPDYLQVGFLKLLPGTGMAVKKDLYGYIAEEFPPYEVVCSDVLSVSEMGIIKELDYFMDNVYNKKRYDATLGYALTHSRVDAFSLFLALARTTEKDYDEVLQERLPEAEGVWRGLLRLDQACREGGDIGAEEEKAHRVFCGEKDIIDELLPAYKGMSPSEIYKRTKLLILPVKLVFDSGGDVVEAAAGTTKILLDYGEKGRRKKKTPQPNIIVLR